MKLYTVVTCPQDDTEKLYHIPDIPGCDTTLCGLSDVVYVDHDIDEHPVNCKACMKVIKFCKNLKFKKEGF